MRNFSEKLYAKMLQQLNIVANEAEHELQKAHRSFDVVKEALKALKDFLGTYQFKDEKDEIFFYKEVKPRFLSELYYWKELFHLYSHAPKGAKKRIIRYYEAQITYLQTAVQRHNDLYIYYQMGYDHNDSDLFLKRPSDHTIYLSYDLELDARFANINSDALGLILAHEKICNYIGQRIMQLKGKHVDTLETHKPLSRLSWTDTKAALIELGYALFAKGAVNSGNAAIKDIMNTLETIFNVQLGNYYRSYLDMNIRKKSRTPYLDSLKQSLEYKMDEEL